MSRSMTSIIFSSLRPLADVVTMADGSGAACALGQTTQLSEADDLCWQGNSLLDQQKPVEAEVKFRQALLLDPSHALHHNGLGRALHGQKKYLAAMAEYQQAIKLDPGNPAFHYNSGLIFFAQNKYADAEAAYRQAIKLSPDDPDYHYVLGDALYEQWKFAEADAEHRRAVKLDLLGGDFHAEQGKFTEVPWGRHSALRKKTTELKQMLGKKL